MTIERRWDSTWPFLGTFQRNKILRPRYHERVCLNLIDEGAMGAPLSLYRTMKIISGDEILFDIDEDPKTLPLEGVGVRYMSYRIGDVRFPITLSREAINSFFRAEMSEYLSSPNRNKLTIAWKEGS